MPLSIVTKQMHSAARTVFQFTLPFISAVTRPSSKGEASSVVVSSELANAAVLLFILWLSLQIVGMASRYVYNMFVTMLKLAMFVVLTVVAISIYNRGFVATQQYFVEFVESVATAALNEQWENMEHSHTAAYSPRQASERY